MHAITAVEILAHQPRRLPALEVLSWREPEL
jgi:hypothetical protein